MTDRRDRMCIAAVAAMLASAPAAAREDAAAAVRAQRDAFNRAIAAGDTATIATILADNVQSIRGTGSEVMSGKAAQLAFWDQLARSAAPVRYVRKPARIDLSKVAPMALETGTWRGASLAAPADWVSGRYVAKWRRIGGAWRIESETYMTVACGGTLCPKS